MVVMVHSSLGIGLVKSFQLQLHIKSLCPNVGAKMLQSLFIITDNKDICMVRLFVSGHSDFKICNVYLSPFYGNRLIHRLRGEIKLTLTDSVIRTK